MEVTEKENVKPESKQKEVADSKKEDIVSNTEDKDLKEDMKMKIVNDESGDVEMPEVKKDEDAEQDKEAAEPRNRKSRWGSVQDNADEVKEKMETNEENSTPKEESTPRGEKRRHESKSPERTTRKRSRSPVKEDEPEIDPENVQLSWVDSDLNLQIDKETFMTAQPLHHNGFGYMWAGVRASQGVKTGKVWYEMKLLENLKWEETHKGKAAQQQTEKPPEEQTEPIHCMRIGWSVLQSNLQLGEGLHSYGYDSDGFRVLNSEFTEYGKKFGADDVIGAFLDLQSDPVTVTYTVNGEAQDGAFEIARSDLPEDVALFPHILTRNMKFEVNFGHKEKPWFQPPETLTDYVLMKNVEETVPGVPRPEKREDCQVIMMVGLPCCGKTYWVNQHVVQNPDKKYTVLGTTHVLEKMKMKGQPRKNHFKGTWSVLQDKCGKCVTKLIDIATQRRRNYILDQTNLFSSAQRRKLRPFEGFHRQAVVVVVADDDQLAREKERQQADGKDIPDSAVLEMKANFSIPVVCEWLNEVTYAELDEKVAQETVEKYNKQGREAGYGPNFSKKNSSDGGSKKQWGRNNNKKHDNRTNRWGSGRGGGDRDRHWSNQRSGGGNWSRHDSRSQHGGGSGGGNWRGSSNNNRMLSGGNNYNRNQSGGGGYRNKNQQHNRNQGSGKMRKPGSWGGNQGGGNWGGQGSWGGQGGWGHQGQGGGSGSGGWGQYNSGQGGQGGNQQWKGYGAQQGYQQGYGQGYPNQYGNQQYANWNYYNQYAQGWGNPQQSGQGAGAGAGDNTNNAQYGQYTQQQQQAAWAQYAQSGYNYSGAQQNTPATTTASTQQASSK